MLASPCSPLQVSKPAIFAAVCCGIPPVPGLPCARGSRRSNGRHQPDEQATRRPRSRRSQLIAAPDEALPDADETFVRTLLDVQRVQETAQRASDTLLQKSGGEVGAAGEAPVASLQPDWMSVVMAREREALGALLGVRGGPSGGAPNTSSSSSGAVPLPADAPAALRYRVLSAAATADARAVLTQEASAEAVSSSTDAISAATPLPPPQAAPSVGPPLAASAADASAVDRALLFLRMHPPGRLLHMARVGEAPTDLASAACAALCGQRASRRQLAVADCFARFFCFCVRRVRDVYEPRWTRRENLSRIRVAPSAAADHSASPLCRRPALLFILLCRAPPPCSARQSLGGAQRGCGRRPARRRGISMAGRGRGSWSMDGPTVSSSAYLRRRGEARRWRLGGVASSDPEDRGRCQLWSGGGRWSKLGRGGRSRDGGCRSGGRVTRLTSNCLRLGRHGQFKLPVHCNSGSIEFQVMLVVHSDSESLPPGRATGGHGATGAGLSLPVPVTVRLVGPPGCSTRKHFHSGWHCQSPVTVMITASRVKRTSTWPQ